MINWPASDDVTLIAQVPVDAASASTVTTGWLSAQQAYRFLAVVQVGGLGSSATVDAKLQQATNSSGGSAKDITGKAITQLTQAGSDSNKVALINLRPSDLDHQNDFTHFRLSITVATAACEIGGLVLALDPVEAPAAHAAFVDEVVA